MRLQAYQFVFAASQLGNIGLTARLEDLYTGTSTPVSLTDTTKINFTVNADAASQGSHRFRIVFTTLNAAPLPVTFTSLKAWQQNGNNIAVQWNVENQLNINQYEIEKSTDGKNFSVIGITKAIDNNAGSETYNWIDPTGNNGNNFYRIESTGVNGTAQYSQTAEVNIGSIMAGILIYPNPVLEGIVDVQLNNMPKGKYALRIVGTNGQVLATEDMEHNGGNATTTIIIKNYLAGGLYNLEVVNPDNSKSITTFITGKK